LHAVSGPQAGRIVEVRHALTVGRGARCELHLDDPKVSRRHATVLRDGGGLAVRDEGSLNGTWLNDERVTGQWQLSRGDRLRIGGSEFIVADDPPHDEWEEHRVRLDFPTELAG
jgi:pSer/pThr/pTyr-binding forkhead associated (FHA) protein